MGVHHGGRKNRHDSLTNGDIFDDSATTNPDMAKPMVPLAKPRQISLGNPANEGLTGVGGSSWGVDKIATDDFRR